MVTPQQDLYWGLLGRSHDSTKGEDWSGEWKKEKRGSSVCFSAWWIWIQFWSRSKSKGLLFSTDMPTLIVFAASLVCVTIFSLVIDSKWEWIACVETSVCPSVSILFLPLNQNLWLISNKSVEEYQLSQQLNSYKFHKNINPVAGERPKLPFQKEILQHELSFIKLQRFHSGSSRCPIQRRSFIWCLDLIKLPSQSAMK